MASGTMGSVHQQMRLEGAIEADDYATVVDAIENGANPKVKLMDPARALSLACTMSRFMN